MEPRLLILILFVVFLGNTHAQKIKLGTYCTEPNFEGECIEFKDSSKFKYSFWTCTGGSIGKGVYSLQKDTLRLDFGANDSNISGYKVVKKTATEKDSIRLKIRLFDEQANILPIAIVKISDKELPEKEDCIAVSITDSLGYAFLSLEKSNVMRFLTIQYVGLSPRSHEIVLNANTEIEMTVDFRAPRVIENERFTFIISTLKKNKFIVFSGFHDGKPYYRTYKKE